MIFSKKTAVSSLAPELVARIMETLDALVVVLDPEGKILLFNRKCQDLTGYKESDVKGRLMWNLLVPERVRPDAKKYFSELTSGQFSAAHSIPWLTRDGRERAISWMSSTVPDKKGKLAWVIATGTDATEQQEQREELSRMTSIANYDPAPALVLNRQGAIVYCNPATQNLLAKGRLAGEIWKKVCPGLNEPAFDRFLRSSAPQSYSSEAKLGSRTFVFEHVSVPDQGMVLVYGFDATELRTALGRVTESEGTLQSFAESSALGCYLTDAKGLFLACNQAFERLFGYRPSELTGKNISKLKLFPRRMVQLLQSSAGKFSSGKGSGFEEFEMLRKDGKHLTAAIAITPVKRAGKLELLNIVADTGTQKHLEKELAKYREQLKKTDDELKERVALTKELLDRQAKSAASRLSAQAAQGIRSLAGVIRNSAYSLELLAGPGSESTAHRQLETIGTALTQLERVGAGEPPPAPEPEPSARPAPAAGTEMVALPAETAPVEPVTESLAAASSAMTEPPVPTEPAGSVEPPVSTPEPDTPPSAPEPAPAPERIAGENDDQGVV